MFGMYAYYNRNTCPKKKSCFVTHKISAPYINWVLMSPSIKFDKPQRWKQHRQANNTGVLWKPTPQNPQRSATLEWYYSHDSASI